MSPVAAPTADKRFRRAHVKPGRRRTEWKQYLGPTVVAALVTGLVAFGVYRTSHVVAHASVLQIDRIAVHGTEHLSRGEVLAVLNGLRGQSLLWANLEGWRQRLLASPWVRDAELHRTLPSTIEVEIWERQPIGIGRIHGEMFLVDERGLVIDQYGPQYAELDLPVIDGLSGNPADGSTTDEARAELAAQVIASVKPKAEIARRLSQIDVSDLHNASVLLTGDPTVLRVGDEQVLARLESYLQLAPTLRERVPDIDSVDLRFGNRIYVRPVGKAAVRPVESAVAASRKQR